MKQYLWMGLILLAVVVAVAGLVILFSALAFRKGNYGKKKIGGILRRYALSRNFKVIDNVTMSDGNKTLQIDHLLVGFFGLLFVTVLQGKGDFYGDLKDAKWTFSDQGKKVSFLNPVAENRTKVEVFRRIMSAKKIYSLPIEAVVVVVGYGKESPLYLSNMSGESQVLDVAHFKKYINQAKFEKDENLDIDHLIDVITTLNKTK